MFGLGQLCGQIDHSTGSWFHVARRAMIAQGRGERQLSSSNNTLIIVSDDKFGALVLFIINGSGEETLSFSNFVFRNGAIDISYEYSGIIVHW